MVLVAAYVVAQIILFEVIPQTPNKKKPLVVAPATPIASPTAGHTKPPIVPRTPPPVPVVQAAPVVEPMSPVQSWFEDLQKTFGPEAALILMIPLAVLVLFLASARRSLAAYASQARVVPKSEVRKTLADEAVRLEPDEPFLRRVQALRRRVDTYSRELDIRRTLQATAARGGVLTPIRAKRYITPEYLILIDERGPQDHLAAYNSALVKALGEAGIAAVVYRFDRDPRRVYLGGGQRAIDVRDLATLFSSHRLFVFSDGIGWIDPSTARPHEWTRIFSEWEHRFLFTWKDPKDWAITEIAFEHGLGFAVLPATQLGLTIAAETFEREGGEVADVPSRFGRDGFRLVDMFAVGSWRWLDSHMPPISHARDLVYRLRAELSPQAFTWLCATAVYPGITWSLTIFLGARLAPPGPFDPTWRAALLEIARLPWMHAGRMPRWLRELLIEELDERITGLSYTMRSRSCS